MSGLKLSATKVHIYPGWDDDWWGRPRLYLGVDRWRHCCSPATAAWFTVGKSWFTVGKRPILQNVHCQLQRNCSGLQCPGWLLCSVQYALCTVQVQCAVFSVQRVLCCERLEQEEATLSPPCLALAWPHPIQRGGSNIILHATLSHRGERSHKSHPIQCGGLSQ